MLSPVRQLHPSPPLHDYVLCKLLDIHCIFGYCLARAHVLGSHNVPHKSASQFRNSFVTLF